MSAKWLPRRAVCATPEIPPSRPVSCQISLSCTRAHTHTHHVVIADVGILLVVRGQVLDGAVEDLRGEVINGAQPEERRGGI